MADTSTTHLGLVKQDPSTVQDYEKDDSNLDLLDSEIWARGKKFNGESVGDDGEFHVRTIPYAENLESSSSYKSDEEFIIRTTGGEASIPQKGDAWLNLLKGRRTHTGYIPQSINMTVSPMARTPDPEITASLNEATFEAYVGEAGTYTITYTTQWSTNPTLYGLTISNTPISGDSITMEWDGENDATVAVDATPRPTPASISATIDDSVFVSYVSVSGTTTLTYSTSWSADPANYGITVTGTPIAGDVITVVYVKEVRGTITQSNPQKFVSTGWNLYNHSAGYARVLKYSTQYNFKISGTYTGLEFSTTLTGTRTTITPVSGVFAIPNDGYIFVSGGNTTNTAIWMTWSDWGSGYNWTGSAQGDFEVYEEHEIDLSTFMGTNFPYGLMQVGTVYDEINLNVGIATSNVVRQAYNATNLANAKASGRQYEYDENYIYIERETPVTYTVSVDGGYTAFDHGMEWYTGTDNAVYSENIYGANLKNKLEREVVTISQQTLTSSEQAQVRTNIGAAADSAVVHNTGDETVAGKKTFTGAFVVNNGVSLPAISMAGSNQSANTGIIYLRNGGTETGDYNNAFFAFVQYAKKSNGTRGNYERYDLPVPTLGDDDDSIIYKIITQKNPSDIPGYPNQIILTSTDVTWDKIWGKISVLASGDSATFYMNSACANALTGSSISSVALIGVISRTSESTFRYLLKDNNNEIHVFNMTNVSSSSAGTYTGRKYSYKSENMTVSKSSSKTYTIAGSSRIRIDMFGASQNLMGEVLVNSSNTGTTLYLKTDVGSDITVTKSDGTLTIANGNTSYALYCSCTIYAGSITEVTT